MKNNLKTNKKPKMWFWELKFVLTKKNKKIKHVFCKHDFCFKLKNEKKDRNEVRNRNCYMCIRSLRRYQATEF